MPFHEHQDALPEREPLRLSRFTLGSAGVLLLAALAAYFVVAYLLLPAAWRRYEFRHPALADAPRVTHTRNRIPGDPVNLALIGQEADLHHAMHAAGWYPADDVTFLSSVRIAEDTVFRRPYDDAPVSPLYLFNRKQDLAFELPVGNDPRKRHHVRFWRSSVDDDAGRPLWFGAATFDERVGLSKTTGQITHHIGPNVDAERDLILKQLSDAGQLLGRHDIENFQPVNEGRNGGGDRWQTDGRLGVGELKPLHAE